MYMKSHIILYIYTHVKEYSYDQRAFQKFVQEVVILLDMTLVRYGIDDSDKHVSPACMRI